MTDNATRDDRPRGGILRRVFMRAAQPAPLGRVVGSMAPGSAEPTSMGGVVCWAHPAYAYKHVFARNDRELICVNLAAP